MLPIRVPITVFAVLNGLFLTYGTIPEAACDTPDIPVESSSSPAGVSMTHKRHKAPSRAKGT